MEGLTLQSTYCSKRRKVKG